MNTLWTTGTRNVKRVDVFSVHLIAEAATRDLLKILYKLNHRLQTAAAAGGGLAWRKDANDLRDGN